jgi:hypothetical protein
LPSYSAVNATVLPSGESLGKRSTPSCDVSRRATPPARGTVQRSAAYVNTMVSPWMSGWRSSRHSSSADANGGNRNAMTLASSAARTSRRTGGMRRSPGVLGIDETKARQSRVPASPRSSATGRPWRDVRPARECLRSQAPSPSGRYPACLAPRIPTPGIGDPRT